MGLSINTNIAALTAYQNLATHTAESGGAGTIDTGAAGKSRSQAPAMGDMLDITTANRAAAQSRISDAALAVQVASLAASGIAADPDAALAAQGAVSANAVLSLLD